MSPPESRHLAQRLLAYEAVAGENSEPAESAAFRVFAKLRLALITLAGLAGFRSLLSRALTLARADAPDLSEVEVAADGSLKGLDELASQAQEETQEGGVVLLTQLIGLLLTFIGNDLTLRLVQDVWPEASFEGMSGKEGKARAHQIK